MYKILTLKQAWVSYSMRWHKMFFLLYIVVSVQFMTSEMCEVRTVKHLL